MRREDLLSLCHYYKGEDEDKCPFSDKIQGRLWVAEMMVCTSLGSMIGDEHPEDDFHSAVFAYVSKWDPYCFRDTLDEYIKVAKPKESIIKVYYH